MNISTLRKRFRNSLQVIFRAFPFGSGSSLQVLAQLRFATLACGLFAAIPNARSQQLPIKVSKDPSGTNIVITAAGKPFTTFLYPDSLAKSVLYPIYAPDGQLVTRGFPLATRPGEPVDHPHHLGLWFNYENVNGLDFWNNSYAIPAAKRTQSYGWIRTDSIIEAGNATSGALSHYPNTNTANPTHTGRAMPSHGSGATMANNVGVIRYAARWTDSKQDVLLTEHTTYLFTATATERHIDRISTLTALTEVNFNDAKDGLLGLRVTKELQIPSNAPGEFVDDKGNVTKVAAGNTPDINGTYLTSEGKRGDSAWGTRGSWCLMYGKKGPDTLSIAIIDHPSNPGYPTYWHARGYGLFAANPLGQKVFSNGSKTMNFHLQKGQSVTFRYRIVIAAGPQSLSTDRIAQLTDEFARVK